MASLLYGEHVCWDVVDLNADSLITVQDEAGRKGGFARAHPLPVRRDRGETFHFIHGSTAAVSPTVAHPPSLVRVAQTPNTYTSVHERKAYGISVNVAPEHLPALNPAWMGSAAEFPRMQLPSGSNPDAFPGLGFRSVNDNECKGL